MGHLAEGVYQGTSSLVPVLERSALDK